MSIPMVSQYSRTIERILNASSTNLLTPSMSITCLHTITSRKGWVYSLSIPARWAYFNTWKSSWISKCTLTLWTDKYTSFSRIIGKLKCCIGIGWTYWLAHSIITLCDNISKIVSRTLKYTFFRYIICKHIIKCAVYSWIWAFANTNSLIIKIICPLVSRAIPCLNTSISSILSKSRNRSCWTNNNTYSQLWVCILTVKDSSCFTCIYTGQSIIITKFIKRTFCHTKFFW